MLENGWTTEEKISHILNSNVIVNMVVTGGGTGCLPTLLSGGGASSILMEAAVPYSTNAIHEYLGWVPDDYTSPFTTRLLATRAFERLAVTANEAEGRLRLGIAATAKLKKRGEEREGRQHTLCVAIQSDEFAAYKEFHVPAGTRTSQEQWASSVIIDMLWGTVDESSMLQQFGKWGVERLLHESIYQEKPSYWGDIPEEPFVLFPGSFNPVHHKHIEMASLASRTMNRPVLFEICVRNTDKPTFDAITVQDNLLAIDEAYGGQPWYGGCIITNTPLMGDKVELIFPRHMQPAIMWGADTWKRLVEEYDANKSVNSLKKLVENKTRILAFPRTGESIYPWPHTLSISGGATFMQVRHSAFKSGHVSSRDIRKKKEKERRNGTVETP